MPTSSRCRPQERRGRGDRGATLVEFALLAPILFGLLFAIVDFGSTYADIQALRQGNRDGARAAVTASVGTNSSCALTGTAATANTSTKQLICMTKDLVGLGYGSVAVMVGLPGSGYAAGQPLLVCAQHELSSISGIYANLLNNKVTTSKVQMRIETTATPAISAVAEDPLVGGSWTWCTGS